MAALLAAGETGTETHASDFPSADGTENAPSSGSEGVRSTAASGQNSEEEGEDDMEALVRQLAGAIRDSDWLEKNPPTGLTLA